MAEVVPFHGIRYNLDIIDDMAQVVAPPYDVISDREQDAYYQRHPNNIIRLILNKSQQDDHEANNVHTRAGDHLRHWVDHKALIRDPLASFYLTTVEFLVGDQKVTRYGIIGLVRIEPFEKGIILPHERTFSKVKSERLQLMKACHANLCSIFGLYSDTSGIMAYLKETTTVNAPNLDFVDDQGSHHKVWCVSDPQALERITGAFRDNRIYIADGHHRYETALNYREWIKARTPNFSSSHPTNYIMMSLSSLEDPGLIIFPAHRLLKNVSPTAVESLLDRAQDYFEIHSIGMDQAFDRALDSAAALLEAHAHQSAIGLLARNPKALKVLVVKDKVMDRLFGAELPEPLRVLDVTVLTHLILMELLGFDQAMLDDETQVSYRTTFKDAAESIMAGEADLAFILNPTKIEQVQRVAEHGLIMPRKSTYFYPKVISGLVLNLLG